MHQRPKTAGEFRDCDGSDGAVISFKYTAEAGMNMIYEFTNFAPITIKMLGTLSAIDLNCNLGGRVVSNGYYRDMETGLWNSEDEFFSGLTDAELKKQLKREYDDRVRMFSSDSVFFKVYPTKKVKKMKGCKTTTKKTPTRKTVRKTVRRA